MPAKGKRLRPRRKTGSEIAPSIASDRSQHTRERLIRAALSCIAELGYHGATMNEIVARAKLSRGAQGHHFPKKLDLVEAAMDYMLAELVKDLREHTNKIRERQEQPEELFQYLWHKYYSAELYMVTLELVVAARSDAKLRLRASAITDKFHQSIDDCWYLLSRGSAFPDKRLMLILNLTMSLLRGMGMQTVLWNRPDYFHELLTEWLQLVKTYFSHEGHLALPAPGQMAVN